MSAANVPLGVFDISDEDAVDRLHKLLRRSIDAVEEAEDAQAGVSAALDVFHDEVAHSLALLAGHESYAELQWHQLLEEHEELDDLADV